jgi:uncharacterized membrane-anchored protein
MDTTPVYLSKTLWLNVIIAVIAFFPGAQSYVTAHPALVPTVIAAANFALRFLTNSKLSLS